MNFIDIQSWWEVPCIAHFCSLFSSSFQLPDFDIEVSFRFCFYADADNKFTTSQFITPPGSRRSTSDQCRHRERSRSKSVQRPFAARSHCCAAQGLRRTQSDRIAHQSEQLSDVPEASLSSEMSGRSQDTLASTGTVLMWRFVFAYRNITSTTLSTRILILKSYRYVPKSSFWSTCVTFV